MMKYIIYPYVSPNSLLWFDEEIRSKAGSCEDGRLQRLLSAGNDLDELRQRVSQQLLAAAEDGRLEQAMQKRSEVRMGQERAKDGPRVLGKWPWNNGIINGITWGWLWSYPIGNSSKHGNEESSIDSGFSH